MTRIFFEKIGPSLFFLAAGTTDTKVRRSTGVTTANSTNKYQKYKSVELGDQLGPAQTQLTARHIYYRTSTVTTNTGGAGRGSK